MLHSCKLFFDYLILLGSSSSIVAALISSASKESLEAEKHLRQELEELDKLDLKQQNADLIRDLSAAKESLEAERRLREELEETLFISCD